MEAEFVNLTAENLEREHLSCIIRSRKPHPGVEAKRQWLRDRLGEGHVFRKLAAKAPVFVEYPRWKRRGYPLKGKISFTCIAYGPPAATRGRDMAGR